MTRFIKKLKWKISKDILIQVRHRDVLSVLFGIQLIYKNGHTEKEVFVKVEYKFHANMLIFML